MTSSLCLLLPTSFPNSVWERARRPGFEASSNLNPLSSLAQNESLGVANGAFFLRRGFPPNRSGNQAGARLDFWHDPPVPPKESVAPSVRSNFHPNKTA